VTERREKLPFTQIGNGANTLVFIHGSLRMNELIGRILDAHGGMDRWNGYEKVDAKIVSGGGLFALKGMLQDSNPRRMNVCARRGAANTAKKQV
jgi:hypothetical protein